MYHITTPTQLFIDAHGPEALLRLLEPPVVTDAALRGMGKEAIATVAEAYNDVLSLARDLVYFVPDLAPRLATPQRIITLFGLIRHQPVFDHAVGLLEDLLVDSPYTPFLGDVPHLVSSRIRVFVLVARRVRGTGRGQGKGMARAHPFYVPNRQPNQTKPNQKPERAAGGAVHP